MVALVTGLSGEITLQVMIHSAGRKECAVTIGVLISPLQLSYNPRRLPIMLTAGGRVGSTLGCVFSSHPDIVTQGRVPYEDKSRFIGFIRATFYRAL